MNGITEEHTFTVTVKADYGDGSGFVPVQGVDVLAVLDGTSTAGSITGGTCDNTGGDTDAAGQCTVVVYSVTAGQAIVNASANVPITGLAGGIDVATNGYGNGLVLNVKTWIDGSLAWTKIDSTSGEFLGGTTFEVCRVEDRFGTDIDDECQSVTDGSAPDVDGDDGKFLLEDLLLGKWTIRETAAPPGYAFDDEYTQEVDLTLLSPDGSAEFAFENERLYKIIVFVCNELLQTLEPSDVTLDGDNATVTVGDVPAALANLGVTEADICGLEPEPGDGGAVYGGLEQGTYAASITIPRVQ